MVNDAPRTISVIIPTLNEAGELNECVRRARANPEVIEIVVVDGGSRDGTVTQAGQLGCRVLRAPAGRGGQLRLGAESALGDVVLLLHADTWLPPEAGRATLAALSDPAVVGGGFWKIFREGSWLMLGSRARCLMRLWLRQPFLGDQGIFIRRDVLARIGGIPPLPFMEEFELCRRLRREGRLALASATVVTSARRFARLGVLRTYWRMNWVTLRYWLGTPADKLWQIYHGPESVAEPECGKE